MKIELDGTALELPDFTPNEGGGFAFALHKGGSTFLDGALARLTRMTETGYFSLPNFLSKHGFSIIAAPFSQPQKDELFRYFSCPGVVFGGWRIYPKQVDLPIGRSTKTFLLVRDPRDILTSYFFHMRSSASITGPNAQKVKAFRDAPSDIDSFVIAQAEEFLSRYRSYDGLAQSSDLMLRRYEDVIFEKKSLLKALCRHFSIEKVRGRTLKLAKILDKVPEKEDETSHIRQVTPGDHRRKLKPETIEQLNHTFAPVLDRYGYSDNQP